MHLVALKANWAQGLVRPRVRAELDHGEVDGASSQPEASGNPRTCLLEGRVTWQQLWQVYTAQYTSFTLPYTPTKSPFFVVLTPA